MLSPYKEQVENDKAIPLTFVVLTIGEVILVFCPLKAAYYLPVRYSK